MYRPEGWVNPHIPMQDEPFVDLADAHFRQIADGKHIAYEASADAMLKGLRRSGKAVSNTDLDVYGRLLSSPEHYPKGGEDEYKGHLVFIPKEEE